MPFCYSDSIILIPGPIGANKRLTQGNWINDLPGTSTQNNVHPSLKEKLIQTMIDCQVDCQKLQYRLDSLLIHLTDGGLISVPYFRNYFNYFIFD